MEHGDSTSSKDQALTSKSFFSKKQKKISTKPVVEEIKQIGEEQKSRSKRSHRSDNKKVDFDGKKLDKSSILSDNKVNKHRVKIASGDRGTHEEDIKFKADEKDKRKSAKKSEAMYKAESILKDPNNVRGEHAKAGVKFDQIIKVTDKEKSKLKEKSKEPDQIKSSQVTKNQSTKSKTGKKQKKGNEKSNYQLTSDSQKDVPDDNKTNYDKSNSLVKTRAKVDFSISKSIDENQLKANSKKEHLAEEKNKRKKSNAGESTLNSLTLPSDEKSRKSRKARHTEETINPTVELTESKTEDKESKQLIKNKELEHKKKKHDKNRETNPADKLNNMQDKKQEDQRSEHRRRSGKEGVFKEKRHDEPEKKRQKPEKNLKSSTTEQVTDKSCEKTRKSKHHGLIDVGSAKGAIESSDKTKEIMIRKKKEQKKKVEDQKSLDTSLPFKEGKKELDLNKSNVKEDTIVNILKNDKCIKLDNKEEVLLKGMQDLTVKELYLMENLKDYEVKLNEQYLKKIKKKKRNWQSTSDTNKQNTLENKSSIPLITNLPICRLPSVKEIFKISNLADYEKKYKEMQDRKRKKHMDARGNEDSTFTPSPSSGRKKFNKFSLESKEEANVEEKIVSPKKSSQWLTKNFKMNSSKNEGGGEHVTCNLGLLCNNESDNGTNQEKQLETGDASIVNSVKGISRGNRTTSKTSIRVSNNKSNDPKESSYYSKLCEKFHKDIREDSKRLLQNLADKNVRVSIKDSSIQSIKKKPSLSSTEALCPLNSHNFNFVLTKKLKKDNQDHLPIKKHLTRAMEQTDIGKKVLTADINHATHERSTHENDLGVSTRKEYTSGNFFNTNRVNRQDPLSLLDNSSQSFNADVNRTMSFTSFSYSMFDRGGNLKSNNENLRNPGDVDLLKRCVSRDNSNNNVIRHLDKSRSRLFDNHGAWFQRSPTLEKILNEIEEYPEKDTDPVCKVQRERQIEKNYRVFSEAEKSKNVLLSYINNYDTQKKGKHFDMINEENKKSHVALTQLSDNLMKENLLLKEPKHQDSLSSLKQLDFIERTHLNSSPSINKLEGRPCLICKKSSASMGNLRGSRKNKTRSKPFKTLLQSESTKISHELEFKERKNGTNTKVVISDPSKRNNILQIQFCGQLNINFNKDKIELGKIENSEFEENSQPLEIKFTEDTKENIDHTNLRPEDMSSFKSSSPRQGHLSSEECLINNITTSSQAHSDSDSSHSSNESNSSNTIVFKGKRDASPNTSKNINDEEKTTEEKICDLKLCQDEVRINTESLIHFRFSNTASKDIADEQHNVVTEFIDNSSNIALVKDKSVCSLTPKKDEILKESPKIIDLRILEKLQTATPEDLDKKETDQNNEEKHVGNVSPAEDEMVIECKNETIKNTEEKCKTTTNLDACVQTVLNSSCDYFFNKLNTLCCDVETCTSSTFESKLYDNKNTPIDVKTSNSTLKEGGKCCSMSTNETSYESDETSGGDNLCINPNYSSDSPLNNKNVKSAFAEYSQDKISGEVTTSSTNEAAANFEQQSPTISPQSTNETIISDSSRNLSGESRDALDKVCKADKNSESLKLNDNEDCKQEPDGKKKLFLSYSEEEAFKYLLMKGIGKTNCNGNKLPTNIGKENNNSRAHPKVMFSAIRKRLECFRSKTDHSKIVSGPELVSSKLKKISTLESRPKKMCPNCSLCSCGELNSYEIPWNEHKPRHMVEHQTRRQIPREPTILNRSNVPKSIKTKNFREDLVCNHLAGIKINDHQSISEFDLRAYEDMKEKKCPNYSGNINYSRNSCLNLYSSGNNDDSFIKYQMGVNESSVHSHLKQHSSMLPRFRGNIHGPPQNRKAVYNEDSPQYFRNGKYCVHDQSWTEDNQRENRNVPLHYCAKQMFHDDISPGRHPYKRFTSNKLKGGIDSKHPPQLSYPNCERQAFVNNTCSKKELNKIHYGPTKLLPSDNIHQTEHFKDNFYYNMEDPSILVNQSEAAPAAPKSAEEEKKKKSRKRKFSKQASKLWKSLFRKSKKYGKDILAYDEVSPEHFIALRPKIPENKLKIKKWLKKISQSKTNDFQYVQEKLFKKLNKIMTAEVTMPLQEVFDLIQKPQFHKDNVSYSGRRKFDRVHTCNYLADDGHYVMITEKLNVRGFLVSIGLKDDVAWEAQDNAELNRRLQTAITEARSWANKITMSQGLLIYILAVMSPSEVNNYFLQIVEAIINSRITNVGTLLSVMMVLKRYERGKYGIKNVISREHVRDLVPKQISETEKRHQENRARFIYLYNIAKRAASKTNNKVDKESAGLLARLTASYSPGLKQYLSLLAHYIAQKLITDKGQLSMAVSYLQSLSIRNFDQPTFEQNCGIPPNKVIIRKATLESLDVDEEDTEKKHRKKHHEKQVGWVKRKRSKALSSSSEKITTEKSTLERKPSTMNLLKEHNKTKK